MKDMMINSTPHNNNQHSNQPYQESRINSNKPSSKTPWIVLGVVVVSFLAVFGYLFRSKLTGDKNKSATSGYQAVFLTNGQVYFGKLSNPNGQYITLTDIFYLQVNQPLQSGAAQQQQQQQPQLSLVKLGNELHGPVDSMQISRAQVLFYEDLKTEGKVAQAIVEYKKNPNAVAPAQSPAAAGQAPQAVPSQQAPVQTQTPPIPGAGR